MDQWTRQLLHLTLTLTPTSILSELYAIQFMTLPATERFNWQNNMIGGGITIVSSEGTASFLLLHFLGGASQHNSVV